MNPIAVEVKDVWKRFPFHRNKPGLKEYLVNLPTTGRANNSYFWALKEVDLEVRKGECLGIIGRNAGGKSTLLATILGTILPTKGSVRVSQKITPLLELGAGFHHDLTGRENVLINGVILGLRKKEVLEKMDAIIAFSEIGSFIDMFVRTYSLGMHLRLAFSVAIHTEPQLLLIDEVLSVGDESFQKKSKGALLQLIKGGVTTILVSHNLHAVREICNRAIWLDEGEIKAEGDPVRVVAEYLKHLESQNTQLLP